MVLSTCKIMFKGKKEIYKKICVVALPIVFQNIIDAAVSSADVLMLNYVGQSAISAVSLAGDFSCRSETCMGGH